jgi:hypothetical protein
MLGSVGSCVGPFVPRGERFVTVCCGQRRRLRRRRRHAEPPEPPGRLPRNPLPRGHVLPRGLDEIHPTVVLSDSLELPVGTRWNLRLPLPSSSSCCGSSWWWWWWCRPRLVGRRAVAVAGHPQQSHHDSLVAAVVAAVAPAVVAVGITISCLQQGTSSSFFRTTTTGIAMVCGRSRRNKTNDKLSTEPSSIQRSGSPRSPWSPFIPPRNTGKSCVYTYRQVLRV